ncbi:hypothetical protein FOA52_015137 [Chlamydomonas sp. UWO 241]|nr:hypothetical protein FOA52_015137 [Chlamydomonas sp. UWO 241]
MASTYLSQRALCGAPAAAGRPCNRGRLQVCGSMKAVRDRIASVKNTSKITEALKLVSAAKVRRAQEAVLGSRPFSETLVQVLFGVNQRMRREDIDSPICTVRPVKCVLLLVVTGDRGLCGGYNNFAIKQAERRHADLKAIGVDAKIIAIGRKGQQYFRRRPKFTVLREFTLGRTPTTLDAQAISDEIIASFITGECDKVELIFTKFVSLIASTPRVQTLIPLTMEGELRTDGNNSVDHVDDEVYRLMIISRDKFKVVKDVDRVELRDLDASLICDQPPEQLIDALLPLYLNSCLLRALQESLASELAARMTAMTNATQNAKDLRKALNISYNRQRQGKITQELAEICGGANAGGG